MENNMKLLYRGNSYEQSETSCLEVRETEIAGKYRGHNWQHKLPKHIPQHQPKMYLQYRGVAYSTSSGLKVSSELSKCSYVSVENKYAKLVTNNTEEIHLENLRRNLERRLEVAKANNNYDLIEMLEKECQQLKLGCQAC